MELDAKIESLLGKPDKDDWLIVEQKLRRGPGGDVEGYGLVSLPK